MLELKKRISKYSANPCFIPTIFPDGLLIHAMIMGMIKHEFVINREE